MPPERTRRQDPASCESCRKKKLRCDRQEPCHNCQSRSIACQYSGSRPAQTTPRSDNVPLSVLQAENVAIRERLQRLESALLHGAHGNSLAAEPSTNTLGASLRSPATTSEERSAYDDAQPYTEECKGLEVTASENLLPLPRLTLDLFPRIASLETILGAVRSGTPPTIILLPPHQTTQSLLDSYVQHLDALHHIIHVPTMRDNLAAMHDTIDQQQVLGTRQGLHYGQLAMLLATLANVAGCWGHGSAEGSWFANRSDASQLCNYWAQCTLDILEHIWRAEVPDLNNVQARLMLGFLVFHAEGLSGKARHLISSAISSALELGLHMIDHPNSRFKESSRAEIIDIELKRRVMWHLAATDWSAALFGGPQDGVYTIQPSRLFVKLPRNITDDDLMTKSADFERPASEHTATAYYLARIRLGKICREVADTLFEIQSVQDPSTVPYARVLALDQQFRDLLETLPGTLRLSTEERRSVEGSRTGAERLHDRQRYFTFLTTEGRRCKLHLPYLLRVQKDPQYAYSRQVCLDSARNIIRLKDVLPVDFYTTPRMVKIIGVLHHFCCAIVILAMDLCVNRTLGDEAARKEEVRNAYSIVESAKDTSLSAGVFLDLLLRVLRKHGVHLHSNNNPGSDRGNTTNAADQLTQEDARELFQPSAAPTEPNSDFDEWWRTYIEVDPGIEPTTWDAIFSDIEKAVT